MSDLISRAELFNRLASVQTLADAYGVIQSMPSAEPRTGKWIDTTSGEHYKCSECGTRASYYFNEENSCEWEMDMSEWLSDFCPNL